MALTKVWNGESVNVASGAPLTTTTAGTGDNVFTAVGSAPVVRITGGLTEIEIANTATAHQFRWASNDLPEWQIRFSFRFTNSATASGAPILYATNATGQFFKITLALDDSLGFLSSTNVFVTGSPPLVKGTGRYRFALWGTAGTDLVHLRMYAPDGSLFWSLDRAVGVSANLKDTIFGRQSGAAFGPGYFSNLAVGNVAAELPAYGAAAALPIFGYVLEPDLVTQSPVTISLGGVLAADLTTVYPVSATFSEYLAGTAVTYRVPYVQPFAVNSPFNVPISTSAVFESATDAPTAAWISRAGSTGGGQINSSTYSIAKVLASTADPLVEVLNTKTGAVLTGVRIPTDFVPAAGLDGAAFVVQPDGVSGHDFYRLAKTDDTHWTTERIVAQNLTEDGIGTGVRASGFSLAGGLILASEVSSANIPHALAMSIPKQYLKLTPTSIDGQTTPFGATGTGVKAVWPAFSQDGQVYVPYAGGPNNIAMGSLFAIPSTVDVEALGLTGASLALARALQRYGAYVADQSDYWALYVSPSANQTTTAAMKTAWRNTLMGLCRRVKTNTSTSVGGGPAPRLAPDAAPLA